MPQPMSQQEGKPTPEADSDTPKTAPVKPPLPEGFKAPSFPSSNIRAIGFFRPEPANAPAEGVGSLEVIFHNGGRYRYSLVPIGIFEDFFKAESPGRYFDSNIKGHFEGHRVKE